MSAPTTAVTMAAARALFDVDAQRRHWPESMTWDAVDVDMQAEYVEAADAALRAAAEQVAA